MMKIAVVGCGAVSSYGHSPAIQNSPEFELVGIADTDSARLKEIQAKYRVDHATADYKDLLDIDGLDAIVVATHLKTHCEITVDALKKGSMSCVKNLWP